MVFGSTYCAISHLEIQDGDQCILIPLGFSMDYSFKGSQTADINCFAYLYQILDAAVEVKYDGNVACIKYIHPMYNKETDYEEYELFMLLHKGFYEKIIKNPMYRAQYLEDVVGVHMNCWDKIRTQVYAMMEKLTNDQILQQVKEPFDKEDKEARNKWALEFMHHPCPEWIVNLYSLATLMRNMGIPPQPIFCSDQHETGKLYEKFRTECIKEDKKLKTK